MWIEIIFSSGLAAALAVIFMNFRLEKFKKSLLKELFEHQTKYSLFHQKQAEIVAELYSKLYLAKKAMCEYICDASEGRPEIKTSSKKPIASEHLDTLKDYFYQNLIYLEEDRIIKPMEGVFESLTDAFAERDVAYMAQGKERANQLKRAYHAIEDKVCPLQKEIRQNIRSFLSPSA